MMMKQRCNERRHINYLKWGGGVEQKRFCYDCLQAMSNYCSGKGSVEARRREVACWGIRQGLKISFGAEFCVWRADLWQYFYNVEILNFKANNGTTGKIIVLYILIFKFLISKLED
jgi:hypothetical protein